MVLKFKMLCPGHIGALGEKNSVIEIKKISKSARLVPFSFRI